MSVDHGNKQMRPKILPKPPMELEMSIAEVEKWRGIEQRDGRDPGPGSYNFPEVRKKKINEIFRLKKSSTV